MLLKTPLLNALAASLYIVFIVFVMTYTTRAVPSSRSFMIPIAVLSLFTLSAAVMGYLFLYQPILLFLENKKKQAVAFFLKTVGIFAVITVLVFVVLYSGFIK